MKQNSQRIRPLPRSVYVPGRDHLERGVLGIIHIDDLDVLFCGNGPSLAVMPVVDDCDEELPFKAPFTEIRVFALAPQTVRGIVDTFSDGYLIAYSGSYFAVIDEQQLRKGGTLCASRIVSTGAFIVGGRRTAENTVQFCFENGMIEEYTISQGQTAISITRVSSMKIGLHLHRKITSTMLRDTDLLGMSDGTVIRLSGAIISRQRAETNSSVIQMALMGDNFLLTLLGSGTIALVDLARHSFLSSMKGRFTAMEQMISGCTFIAGDLDGSLHSISVVEGQLIYRLAFKDRFRGRICQLLNLRRSHLVVGTATGGLRVVSREPFLPQLQRGFLANAFSMKSTQFVITRAGWVSIENGRIKIQPDFKSPPPKYPVGSNFSEKGVRIKYYYGIDRETVCCYGKNSLWFITTADPVEAKSKADIFKCELKNHFKSANSRIVSLVLQGEYVFVQCDDNYQVAFLVDFHGRQIAKKFAFIPLPASTTLTTATILERLCNCCSGQEIVFVAGYRDGSVAGFSGNLETTSLKLRPIMVDVRNSYVVSSMSKCDSIFLLTAKGMCFEVWEPCLSQGEHFPWSRDCANIAVRREWSLGAIIGSGSLVSDAVADVVVSGFKGNMLTLYNILKDEHIVTVETAGPRYSYQIFALPLSQERGTITLVHTIPRVEHPVLHSVTLPRTTPYAYLRHSAPINVMLYLKHFADPTTYFITGDSSGLLCYSKFTQVTTHSVDLIGDFQLNGAILCAVFEKEVLYVSTSNGFVYTFQRYSEEMLLALIKIVRIASPAESMVIRALTDVVEVVCLCRDGFLRFLCRNPSRVISTVHFTPGQQKGSEVVELDSEFRFFYSLGNDFVLRRTRPYNLEPSGERITLDGVPLSSFYMRGGSFRGSFDEILAGTPDGWMYLMWFHRKDNRYVFVTADRYHTHPIIEIRSYCVVHNEGRYKVISLDNSGFVVVREYRVSPSQPYLTLACSVRKWQSPINSPRTMEVFPDKAEMFVCGEGASWYYLLDENRA